MALKLMDHGLGSVGLFAIQLAHTVGYKVVTTASLKNHELCKSLGADAVVDVRPSASMCFRLINAHIRSIKTQTSSARSRRSRATASA